MWFQYKKKRARSKQLSLSPAYADHWRKRGKKPLLFSSFSRDVEPLAVPVLGLVSNSRPRFVMFVLVVVAFPQYITKTSPSFSMGIVGSGKYTSAREKRHPRGDYERFKGNINCSLETRKEKTYVDRLLNTRRGNQTNNYWINQ